VAGGRDPRYATASFKRLASRAGLPTAVLASLDGGGSAAEILDATAAACGQFAAAAARSAAGGVAATDVELPQALL
jgi:hypothetical protein